MKTMKTFFILVCGLAPLFVLSQVGIGTETPTKDLDVNGEVRIRDLPVNSDGTFVVTDNNGNLGKMDAAINVFVLADVETDVATAPVNFTTGGINQNAATDDPLNDEEIINNIDLGLSISLTVPANMEAVVIVNYSVPASYQGNTTNSDLSNVANLPRFAYVGVRFLKQIGTATPVEAEAGSRTFSLDDPGVNGAITNRHIKVVTVTNTYVEEFSSQNTARRITYTLNGFIEERARNIPHLYRFNMFATGRNFNWGRATISGILYVRRTLL